jgi:hypothetical protein
VLQRFSARVPNNAGADLSFFLIAFFGGPIVSMPVGPSRAFILSYLDSILALTYKETDAEFFVTTCLTINEIHSLEREMPPCVYNLHYGPAFVKPRIRNWIPTQWMMRLHNCWQRKIPLPPPRDSKTKPAWSWLANWARDHEKKEGHGPGSRFVFTDHIPGPLAQKLRPNETEEQYDELAVYKQILPKYDWDAIFAKREGGETRSKSNDKQ